MLSWLIVDVAIQWGGWAVSAVLKVIQCQSTCKGNATTWCVFAKTDTARALQVNAPFGSCKSTRVTAPDMQAGPGCIAVQIVLLFECSTKLQPVDDMAWSVQVLAPQCALHTCGATLQQLDCMSPRARLLESWSLTYVALQLLLGAYLITLFAHKLPLNFATLVFLHVTVLVALQTEKFYDMLGTGSFAVLALGSLLKAPSMHARKVRCYWSA